MRLYEIGDIRRILPYIPAQLPKQTRNEIPATKKINRKWTSAELAFLHQNANYLEAKAKLLDKQKHPDKYPESQQTLYRTLNLIGNKELENFTPGLINNPSDPIRSRAETLIGTLRDGLLTIATMVDKGSTIPTALKTIIKTPKYQGLEDNFKRLLKGL